MDDLAHRRKLEIEIDNLKIAKSMEVLGIAQEAEIALKEKKFDKAQDLVKRGKMLSDRLPLIDFLVTSGGMKSKAEARRTIESQGVLVDGRVAKQADIDIRYATSIKVGSRELL